LSLRNIPNAEDTSGTAMVVRHNRSAVGPNHSRYSQASTDDSVKKVLRLGQPAGANSLGFVSSISLVRGRLRSGRHLGCG
jgi:hypothetical protein